LVQSKFRTWLETHAILAPSNSARNASQTQAIFTYIHHEIQETHILKKDPQPKRWSWSVWPETARNRPQDV